MDEGISRFFALRWQMTCTRISTFIEFYCKTIWQKQQESNYSQQQLPSELN